MKSSILDYNINLFFDNISKKYNINRNDLESFKDYIKIDTEFNDEYIITTRQIYQDINQKEYILIEKNNKSHTTQSEYFAVQTDYIKFDK